MPADRNPGQLSSLALGAVLALGWLTASGAAIALVTLTGDSYEEYPVGPVIEPTDYPTYLPTTRTGTRVTRTTTRRSTTPATTVPTTPTTEPFGGGFGGPR